MSTSLLGAQEGPAPAAVWAAGQWQSPSTPGEMSTIPLTVAAGDLPTGPGLDVPSPGLTPIFTPLKNRNVMEL